ncbi:hypothetical protein HCN44_005100 [Aphidius gifuensis]|uniref:Odorant-binding protein n=2 Tax=Aphidius gifuensis TaxID=684658 RepID=A0A834XU13_APHGI|nr:hypothetical protein HCN44_005100 [Aphidius gifuensis]
MVIAICPATNETVDVNLKELSGGWYVTAATPVTGQVGKCLYFEIEKSENNEFIMNFTSTSYRNNQRIWWDVRGFQNGKILMAKWRLSTSAKPIGPFQHQVVAINHDEYIAIIVCATDTKHITKGQVALILSRQKILPPTILINLKTIMAKYVDRNDILDIDNTCDGITI